MVLWVVAVLTALHQVRSTYVDGPGGDLLPVWEAAHAFLRRRPPYHVEAFVYPPSALLLFAPLGLPSFRLARLGFHGINVACIAAAAILVLRHFRVPWWSPVAPAVVFGVFVSGLVASTLGLENVSGVVLLSEVAMLVLLAAGRDVAAGIAFGLGLAVKPVLAPLLLVLWLGRKLRTAAVGLAVPAILSLLALPLIRDVSGFWSDVVPFLVKGNYEENDLINTSIRGALDILDLPSWLGPPLRVLVLAAALLALLRRWRAGGDERLALTEMLGIVLAATFLVFSFSWIHYCLFLLPVFVSLAYPASTVDGWRLAAAGAALYLVASPDVLPRLNSVRVTAGLLALLAALWPTPRGHPRRPPSTVEPASP